MRNKSIVYFGIGIVIIGGIIYFIINSKKQNTNSDINIINDISQTDNTVYNPSMFGLPNKLDVSKMIFLGNGFAEPLYKYDNSILFNQTSNSYYTTVIVDEVNKIKLNYNLDGTFNNAINNV